MELKYTAPRVTPDDLEANIVDTEIVKHVSKSGQVLRWAVLTTRNGFAVTGRPSASVSPDNDNAQIGEEIAIENAKNEIQVGWLASQSDMLSSDWQILA